MMQTNTARTAAITERRLEGIIFYQHPSYFKIYMNFFETLTCCAGYLYKAPVYRLLIEHVRAVIHLDGIICPHQYEFVWQLEGIASTITHS